MSATAAVGLYSISVRGLDVPDLLAWAAAERIPFVHLRGGPRGFDLATRDTATLRVWRRAAEETVPITGVTTDTDVADLLAEDPAIRTRACGEVVRLAEAAIAMGAGWLRLLARTPPAPGRSTVRVLREGVVPTTPVPLLIELHHPGWLHPAAFAALDDLLQRSPNLRLLADTAQLGHALTTWSGSAHPALEKALSQTEVLHLSDSGGSLETPGHAPVAELAARRIAAGHRVEVAVEWTGSDRTQAACLARYRAAAAWWTRVRERVGGQA